jgi:hypothetical protein
MATAPPFSLHFAYYGADAVPSAEETRPPFGLTTDAEFERMIGPIKRNDLMGAAAKGIGGYLRLVHKAEDFSSIPEHLGELLRRAA